jgi:carbonic anhydrase/acetyltransferase-like protein (isoleucine patch superfamily)
MSTLFQPSKLAIAMGLSLMSVSSAYAATCNPSTVNRPVCPSTVAAAEASYLDATVLVTAPTRVTMGKMNYFGPFAELTASGTIVIGNKTNLQDNVSVYGTGNVTLGDEVILAHGAQVKAPAKIGKPAVVGGHNASFVGFNSLIDGATMENDAMVLHLARVAPGITIKHGKVVLSGKNITTQAQADNPALGKVIPISEGLREFMHGVLHVNETFAMEYTNMHRQAPNAGKGINLDPGQSAGTPEADLFNRYRNTPLLDTADDGEATIAPTYRNRIIGDVRMFDTFAFINSTAFGNKISLRADEGEYFQLGHVTKMSDRTTFHALEHNAIVAGHNVSYGVRSIVHGGKAAPTELPASTDPHAIQAVTTVGDNVTIGNLSVVFKSSLANNVKVGCGSLVEASKLPAGYVVPAMTIVQNYGYTGVVSYKLEWNPGC